MKYRYLYQRTTAHNNFYFFSVYLCICTPNPNQREENDIKTRFSRAWFNGYFSFFFLSFLLLLYIFFSVHIWAVRCVIKREKLI